MPPAMTRRYGNIVSRVVTKPVVITLFSDGGLFRRVFLPNVRLSQTSGQERKCLSKKHFGGLSAEILAHAERGPNVSGG